MKKELISDEEVKEAQVEQRTYLRGVIDELENQEEKAALLNRLESVLCKLLSNDDKIITDTLAEKLQTGIHKYLLDFEE